MIKLFLVLFSIFTILSSSSFNDLYAGATTEHLNSLIKEGLAHNPQVQAALEKWEAQKYKIPQVRSLPDPTFHYSFFGESVETRVGPQKHKVGASLKLPFPSKLVEKGRAQTKSADISQEEYEAYKRELIKNIKVVYYDIYWIDKAIQVTNEEKVILENIERVAKRKYETDISHQQDVVKAQVEISILLDKLIMLEQNRKSLSARMNSLLSRPKNRPFGKTTNVKPKDLTHDQNQLREMAKKSRQELKAAGLAIEEAEHEQTLAKLNYIPDFSIGFDYIFVEKGHTPTPNDGKDAWMSTVSMNIPIWFNKLRAGVNEKKAALQANKRIYKDVENNILYEIEALYSEISANKRIVDLYKTALIPQSELAFDSAKSGYESGKVDFLDWLDAQRTLLQTRLSYYKAVSNYQKAVASLERTVGRDL